VQLIQADGSFNKDESEPAEQTETPDPKQPGEEKTPEEPTEDGKAGT
jgi:hypothetical protein